MLYLEYKRYWLKFYIAGIPIFSIHLLSTSHFDWKTKNLNEKAKSLEGNNETLALLMHSYVTRSCGAPLQCLHVIA